MRTVLTEFTKRVGVDVVHVLLFREADGYVYVREAVESSGNTESDSAMELPFSDIGLLQRFIDSDPYQAALAQDNAKVLRMLSDDMALRRQSARAANGR
jgi:hypothetical protein